MGFKTWQYKSDKGKHSTRIMICGDSVYMHQSKKGEFDGNAIHMSAKKLRKLLKRYK